MTMPQNGINYYKDWRSIPFWHKISLIYLLDIFIFSIMAVIALIVHLIITTRC